jgi:hypothetical protein
MTQSNPDINFTPMCGRQCVAIYIAQALSRDHFVERTSMTVVDHHPHHLVAAPRYAAGRSLSPD